VIRLWLCHSDARQVSDLPKANPHRPVSDQIAVVDLEVGKAFPASRRLAAHRGGRAILLIVPWAEFWWPQLSAERSRGKWKWPTA